MMAQTLRFRHSTVPYSTLPALLRRKEAAIGSGRMQDCRFFSRSSLCSPRNRQAQAGDKVWYVREAAFNNGAGCLFCGSRQPADAGGSCGIRGRKSRDVNVRPPEHTPIVTTCLVHIVMHQSEGKYLVLRLMTRSSSAFVMRSTLLAH